MAKKRKRVSTHGVMVAWSNGKNTHISPSQIEALHNKYQQELAKFQMREYKRYSVSDVANLALRRSLVMEEYSDMLWNLDQHIASFKILLLAAEETFDNGTIEIDRDEVAYNHPNLVAFRRLAHRCRERALQEPRLMPILLGSDVYDDYNFMEKNYTQDDPDEKPKKLI